ncbi:ABC transporter permease [Oribacterium asaccharolyticum]|uniref:ABC transporter permease n=1 Tax=Oribacterium asaccharolyticum TaxID=1501332 RepID=UPI0028E3C0E6|nr:iron ABC transporter permease [Oribacterium asaccharolyticum]
MAFLQRKRVDLSTLFSKDKNSDIHTKEYGNPFFWIFVFLLCFPLVLFIVYPTMLLFIQAFQGDSGFAVFSDVLQRYRLAFWNSIESSFFSAFLSTIFAFFLAYGILQLKSNIQRICLIILSISLVSPPFISSLSFISLYGRRGLISYRLLKLSLDPYNKYGVIGMQSLHFTCLNILFFIHALRAMDGKLFYSARDLGAGPLSIVKDIVLPLLKPAFLASFFISFLRALADFGTPVIIGGRYSTLASEIYLQLIGYSDFQKTAVMNILLLFPALFSFYFYRRAMEQSDKWNGEQKGRTRPDFPANFLIRTVLSILLCLFFLFECLQYLSIFLYGFLRFDQGEVHFTLENMGELFQYNLSTMYLTLALSVITGFFGSFFSFVLAYIVERKLPFGKKTIDFVLSLPYLLPGTCFGLAYILAFNKAPFRLTGTVWIILFSLIFRQMPLGSRMASAAISSLPKNMERAGRDLGANPIRVFLDILFPILLPSFLSSVYNQFTQSLTTMGAVIFLISAKYKVLVYTLFDAINRGSYNVASLISGIMILLSLAFYLLLEGCRFLAKNRY